MEHEERKVRADALNDEELNAVSGGTGSPSLQKPQILGADELADLLGETQAISDLNTGSNTFTVL